MTDKRTEAERRLADTWTRAADKIRAVRVTWRKDSRRWVMTREDDGRNQMSGGQMIRAFRRKNDAVQYARGYCSGLATYRGPGGRNSMTLELEVHNRLGEIVLKDSYGSDPRGRG